MQARMPITFAAARRCLSLCILLFAVAAPPASASEPVLTDFTAGLRTGHQPQKIVAGPDGNMWFTQGALPGYNEPGGIARISMSGVVTQVWAPGPCCRYPVDMAAGPDGNLWFTEGVDPHFADQGADGPRTPAIARITPGGQVTEFTAGLDPSARPAKLVLGPGGDLWFSEWGSNRIGRIDTGGRITEYSLDLPPIQDGFTAITSIGAGPDGAIWFVATRGGVQRDDQPRQTGGLLGRVTADGAVTHSDFFDMANQPTWVGPGPDGAVWFTNAAGVWRVNASFQASPVPLNDLNKPGPGAASWSPELWAIGPDGKLWSYWWAAGPSADATPADGFVRVAGDLHEDRTTFPPHAPMGRLVNSLASGPGGTVWFTATAYSTFATLQDQGAICRLSVPPPPPAALAGPRVQHVLRQRGVYIDARSSELAGLGMTGSIVVPRTSARSRTRTLRFTPVLRVARRGQRLRVKLTLSKSALKTIKRVLKHRRRLPATIVATVHTGQLTSTSRRRISLRS
jgi:virginiamycin B lyase